MTANPFGCSSLSSASRMAEPSFRSSACDSQRLFGVLAIRLIPHGGFVPISPRRTACSRIVCHLEKIGRAHVCTTVTTAHLVCHPLHQQSNTVTQPYQSGGTET